MKKALLLLLLLLVLGAAYPLSAQTDPTPPPPPEEDTQGTNTLSPKVCPSDYTDGPLYADGTTYYGIPARHIVEGFLAPPHDSFGRVESGTQNVSALSLRVLADGTDYNACQRLTTFLTNGTRSAPPSRGWVYFTAGGFYFVSQWKPAQALSNYTTGYAHVMVFNSDFAYLGAYAF